MARTQLNTVFQQLRRVTLLRDGAGLTDGRLLDLFISQRDDGAFEALVRRHGPMVVKVCRRVLGNHHDAEDAFQATFLVLSRKAASVKPREMLANWLHGVAYRTALKARTLRAKKRARERPWDGQPEPASADQGNDWREVIDQELDHLDKIYRLPIILCDLEGKSIKMTAQQLGWPQGTVAGRLARGRKMLAKRLARHGLALAGGVELLAKSATACVPSGLVAATVRAAGACAAGQAVAAGVISGNVAVLMEGAFKTMFFAKAKTVIAVLLVAVSAGAGGGIIFRATSAAAQTEGEQNVQSRPETTRAQGTGPGSGHANKPNQKNPGVVGQIIIVGCDPIASALIRQEVLRLYPGQVFDGEALRKAERRLAALDADYSATIKVIGGQDKEIRDILVTVKEKDPAEKLEED